jgi:glyoxylase-like metal-dependent hydrolase (beta-lactamase superfamily II)
MYDFQKGCIRYIKGGKYPQCHSVFIEDEGRVLIDPACDPEKLKSIQSKQPIDVIINSHCHEDHFQNNYLFPDAQLWVPTLEADFFVDINHLINAWTYEEQDNPEHREAIRRFLIHDVHYQERKPDRLLIDEETIEFGKTRMTALHMPGHSQGHMCFHFPDERVMYTADLDLVKAGPYYGDQGSDIDDMIDSLERLAEIDVDTYLTAHGKIGIYDGNPEYVQNYLNTLFQREERLLEYLNTGPKTLQEITDLGIIYGKREITGAWDLTISERYMMKKHLQRLERLQRVRQENDHYMLYGY